jgi:hypothetical protein
MSDVEVWQKFLLFFIQETHNFSEFDMANENQLENTTNLSRMERESDIPEEDGIIRPITLSDWSIRKNH